MKSWGSQRVLLFIDGLEVLDPSSAREMLDDLLRRTSGTRVKVVIACKTAFLRLFLLDSEGVPSRLSNEAFVINGEKSYMLLEMGSQQFSRVRERYRSFYGIDLAFEDRMLADCRRTPFLLRVAFEVAIDRQIDGIAYTSVDFFTEYLKIVYERFDRRESIQDMLNRIVEIFYSRNSDTISIQDLREDLDLSTVDDIPDSLFTVGVLHRHTDTLTTYVEFQFPIMRDFLIAFSHLKLQDESQEGLAQQLGSMRFEGVHLDVIKLYYSLASEEHKRVFDGDVFSNALTYVTKYEEFIEEHFPVMRQAFEPYTIGKIGFLGYLDLKHGTVPAYGFRALQDQAESVLLIPQDEDVDPEESNQAFIRGVRTLSWRPSLKGFRGVDFDREILWHDIGPALDEITAKGLLDESSSRTMLMEKVFSTTVEYVDEIIQIAKFKFTGFYEPVRLDSIRNIVLRKRAERILRRKFIQRKFRRGEIDFPSRGIDRYSSTPLTREELDKLDRWSWWVAKQGKFLQRRPLYVPGPTYDYIEAELCDDIDLLQRMRIYELEQPIILKFSHYEQLMGQEDPSQHDTFQSLASLFQSFLDEYQRTVTQNFPTLSQRLPLYQLMPVTAFLRIEVIDDAPKMALSICKEEPSGVNRVIICSSSDIKFDRNNGKLFYKDRQYDRLMHASGDLYSYFFPTFGRPWWGYMPYKVNFDFTPVRNLVYKKIRSELKSAFTLFASELGADSYSGRDLFSRDPLPWG